MDPIILGAAIAAFALVAGKKQPTVALPGGATATGAGTGPASTPNPGQAPVSVSDGNGGSVTVGNDGAGPTISQDTGSFPPAPVPTREQGSVTSNVVSHTEGGVVVPVPDGSYQLSRPGWVWVPDSGTVPGHWERASAAPTAATSSLSAVAAPVTQAVSSAVGAFKGALTARDSALQVQSQGPIHGALW